MVSDMWYRLSYRNEISSNLVKMENEGKLKLVHCPFWLLSAGETEIIFPFSQKNQIFCIHKNQDSISLFLAHSKNMTLGVKGHWFGGLGVRAGIHGSKPAHQNLKLRTGSDQDQEKFENLGPIRTGQPPDRGYDQVNDKPDKVVRYFVP